MNKNKEFAKRMKQLSIEYQEYTGKSLRLVGEIAELEVSAIMNLSLIDVNNYPGYDAISKKGARVQIKACIEQPSRSNSHFTRIKLNDEWDILACALYSRDYELKALYVATQNMLKDIERITKYGSLMLAVADKHCKLIYGERYNSRKQYIDGMSKQKAIEKIIKKNMELTCKEVYHKLLDMGYTASWINTKNNIYKAQAKIRRSIK